MHAKYEVPISYGSKVIAKVKVDNRQTDRQTNRQDKNNMPPIIRSGGIKKFANKISFTAGLELPGDLGDIVAFGRLTSPYSSSPAKSKSLSFYRSRSVNCRQRSAK